MLGLFKVSGNSMLPRMADGDFVLTRRLLMRIVVGDDVVVQHPEYGRLVKRVLATSDHGLWLTGENHHSVTPEAMGWVALHYVMGKVFYHVSRNSMPS